VPPGTEDRVSPARSRSSLTEAPFRDSDSADRSRPVDMAEVLEVATSARGPVYTRSPEGGASERVFFLGARPNEMLTRDEVERHGPVDWFDVARPVPPIPVPPVGAPWREVSPFALTYNAYERDGDPDELRRRGDLALGSWIRGGRLPQEMAELRSLLFFEQRWVWHVEEGMGDAFERPGYRGFIDALLEAIARASGGFVPGPPDPLP